jgi:hypothetical protein
VSTASPVMARMRARLGVEGSIWLLGGAIAVAAAALYAGVVAALPH